MKIVKEKEGKGRERERGKGRGGGRKERGEEREKEGGRTPERERVWEGGRRKEKERGVWLTFTISCAVMDPMTDCMGQASPLLWWANLAMSRSSNSSTCGRTSDQSDLR